jgi:NADH-quinone oxidoreductase subunit L
MFTKDTTFARFLGFPLSAMPADADALHELEIIMTVIQGVIIAVILGTSVYLFTSKREAMASLGRAFPKTAAFMAGGCGLDRISDVLFVRPVKAMARFSARIIENRVIDGAVNGAGRLTLFTGQMLAALQTGRLRHYAFAVMSGTFIVLGAALYFAGIF